jgi:hypothetical protein
MLKQLLLAIMLLGAITTTVFATEPANRAASDASTTSIKKYTKAANLGNANSAGMVVSILLGQIPDLPRPADADFVDDLTQARYWTIVMGRLATADDDKANAQVLSNVMTAILQVPSMTPAIRKQIIDGSDNLLKLWHAPR